MKRRGGRQDASNETGAALATPEKLAFYPTAARYLQALVQYNDVIDNWSTNLRFGWLQAANTGLFVVYNENRATERDPLGIGVRDRSFTIKYSHAFDLLD